MAESRNNDSAAAAEARSATACLTCGQEPINWVEFIAQGKEIDLGSQIQLSKYGRDEYMRCIKKELEAVSGYFKRSSVDPTTTLTQYGRHLLNYSGTLSQFHTTAARTVNCSNKLIEILSQIKTWMEFISYDYLKTPPTQSDGREDHDHHPNLGWGLVNDSFKEAGLKLTAFKVATDDLQQSYHTAMTDRTELLKMTDEIPTISDTSELFQTMIAAIRTASQTVESHHKCHLSNIVTARDTYEQCFDWVLRNYDFDINLQEEFSGNDYRLWLVRPKKEADTPNPSVWNDQFVPVTANEGEDAADKQ